MPGRPRILILSAYYFPFQGGTETHARTLAMHLWRAGFGVLVVTKRDDRGSPARDRVDDIPVHRVWPAGVRTGWRKWLMLPFAIASIIALRREFDLIYCPGYQGIGLAAIVAGRWLSVPVILRSGNLGVLTGRQWDAPLRRWHLSPASAPVRWLKARVTRVYKRAAAFACNCRENEKEAIDAGVPPDRVHYLPNAVDSDRYRPAAPGERDRVRADEGWPTNARIWMYVGRLSVEKGVLDLVRAWTEIAEPDMRLVLVGPDMSGSPLDAGVEARRLVADRGLAPGVIFHGEATDPARLLRAADFYVQPSHYETFSNALIEAMATGLPIVASRVSGMLDCIVDGENGVLANPADPADLARRMRGLMADPSRASALARRARETVTEQFSEPTILRRFEDLFEATARRGSRGASARA